MIPVALIVMAVAASSCLAAAALGVEILQPAGADSEPRADNRGAHTAFVTTWETTGANETITIPVSGTYTIDWGDGTPSTSTSGIASHTYANPGNHTVSITGGLERINLSASFVDAQKLRSIDQWGDIKWTSMESAFEGAAVMTYAATDAPDLSGVADMSFMFSEAAFFDGNISSWNVSQVNLMTEMFFGATSFNGNVSSWNVSQVTDMGGMFSGATAFNGNVSSWDVSQVTDMNSMFYSATSFNQPLNDWNVSQVTGMGAMFSGGATAFNRDLNDWDVSQVTDMDAMFWGATAFNGDISDWNVSQVADMNSMFYRAISFNQDLNDWDVSQVTNMFAMFFGATDFNQPLSSWDVSQVTVIASMFVLATSFDQNLGNWYVVPADTAYAISEATLNVTTISAQNGILDGHSPNYGIGSGGNSALFGMTGDVLMFKNTPSAQNYTVTVTAPGGDFGTGNSRTLTVTVTADADDPDRPFITTWRTTTANENITIPGTGTYTIDWGDDTPSTSASGSASHTYVTPGTHTVSITGGLERINLSANATNAQKLQSIEQWGGIEWTTMQDAFNGASAMVYNASDAPDLSQVTDMQGMFYGASAFDGDLSGWDVSQVTNMHTMFNNAASFDGNLSGWDVSKVTDMNNMFFGAAAFNQDISGWNVSQVTDMSYMFTGAIAFNQDISEWNVSQVTNMGNMFTTAIAFNQDISEWNVSQVTDMGSMFAFAAAFNQDISEWDVSQVGYMTTMFAGAGSFQQNLGKWYVVPADTAYATSEATLNVTTISAQNSVLDGHSPEYDIGSGDDSALFNMTGSTLMFNDTPSVGSHAANVTASGTNVFEGENNWRVLKITVAGADNNPPVVGAGSDLVLAEGASFTLSGSATDQDADDTLTYSWSQSPETPAVVLSGGTTLTPTITAPAVESSTVITLTLTVNDGTVDVTDEMDITVRDTAGAFITTWRTTSDNEEITIPGTGTYDVVWGDGQFSGDASGNAAHAYADAGNHTVSISGGFERIFLKGDPNSAPKLQSIEQWGDIEWTTMNSAFQGASSMEYNATDEPDLSVVADMTNMFIFASSFNGDLSGWDVSGVTDMTNMFASASSFDGDISGWDVSSVTDMSSIFSGATAFNQPLSSWDVSRVTDMGGMFAFASDFNQDLSSWDVSRVTDMGGMFRSAAAFNGNVSSWDVSQVTDMDLMFHSASNFNGDISGWDVSQVTGMNSMFFGATDFDQNLGKWYVVPEGTTYDTSEGTLNVTTISAQNRILDGHSPDYGIGSEGDSALFDMTGDVLMFKDTPSAQDYTVTVTAPGGDFGTGNSRTLTVTVTADDPDRPFITTWETTSANETITIPGTGTYDVVWGDAAFDNDASGSTTHTYAEPGTYVVKITGDLVRFHLDGISANAPKLQSIEQWGDMEWTTMEEAFWGASNMVYNATDEPDLSRVTDMTAMFYDATSFNGNVSSWDVSQVTIMTEMFSGATAFNQPLSGWNVSQVTDMGSMFFGATAFNQPLSGWNVSQVTNMYGMFTGATAFNQSLSGWNVSQVTNMYGMFTGATAFNQSLSGWDVSQVADMNGMFAFAASFNQPLSGWNVSQVADMNGMFAFAASFNQPLSGWDVSQVASMTSMFSGATSFNGNVSSWDVSKVTVMAEMFSGATSFNQPLSGWNVSQVTVMSSMFRNATSFNQPLSGWDVSQVAFMTSMFSGATYFNGNVSSWNVSQVTDMDGMFNGATAFNQPLSEWDVSQVAFMTFMFFGATSFDQNLGNWYVVPEDTAYATSEETLNVTTISAQNGILDGHSPTYGIGLGDDSGLFNMTGSTLMFKDTPSVGSHAANVTASEGSVFEGENNWRVLEIAVAGTGTDATPPDIILIGDDPYTIQAGTAYRDPGYSCADDTDDDKDLRLRLDDSELNVNAPGDYTITYTCTDSSGNIGTATRTVIVVGAYNAPPVITINGSSELTIQAGSAYEDAGATCTDETDGSLQVTTTGTANTDTPGTYHITYACTDSSGNESTATRQVRVVAVGPPEDNNPPRVNAGPDQTVGEGDTVALSGSAADPDAGDSVVSYSWSAPQGSGITFADGSSASTTFTAPAVDGDATFTLTLTAGDGTDSGSDGVDVTVKETGSAFITTWRTTSDNEAITIPGTGTYDVVWGDGTFSDAASGDGEFFDGVSGHVSHEYETPGTHTVSITGGLRWINLADNLANAQKLQSIEQWGGIKWDAMAFSFQGASNMVYNADDAPDLSEVADMTNMFRKASSFDGDLSSWDVSQATDMSGMFTSATAFDGDVSPWDVSSVTDMSIMFALASSFNGDLSSWDVSSATGMGHMFLAANSFQQNLGNWYVVPADTAYATSEGTLNVTTVSAQNSVLDGHSPEYGIGSGDGPDLFNMTGSTLMFRDTPSVGRHPVNVTASGSGVFEGENSWRMLEIAVAGTGTDTTPPDITLDGANPYTVQAGSAYADPGYSCADETDAVGDLRLELDGSGLDANTPGTYTITYTCTDLSGNMATDTRTVTVAAAADTIPPIITLDGPSAVTVTAGTAFDDPGVTCTDETDPNPSLDFDIVDIDLNTPGDYTVTYTCTDSSGNSSTATWTVTVIAMDAEPPEDNIPPIITLDGPSAVTVTASTAFDDPGVTCTDETDPNPSLDFDIVDIDLNTPGDYTVTYTCTDSSGNSSTATWTVTVIAMDAEPPEDNNPPTITLNGLSAVTITAGTTYTEQGATCTDDTDPAPTVTTTGTVDTSSPGTYTVTYACTDSSGNGSTISRAVTVVAAETPIDTTDPVIAINGSSELTIQAGSTYTEQGATCTDDTDGSLQVTTTGTVDTSNPGTYTVTYACTDSSGNGSTISRTVTVVDTTDPVIAINGSSELTITAGTAYTEQGATCTDDTDGSLQVTTTGTVDTSSPGTYTVTYACTDSSGNGSTISRTVTVVDTTDPVIAINGSSELTIQAGSTYEDAGATCTDETDGSLTPITISDTVDTSSPGTYTVTYACTDSSGNGSTISRTVTVVAAETPIDTTDPVITINGSPELTIQAGSTYTEQGATCTDDTDGSLQVTTTGTVNTSMPGTYTVTYACTDSSGNNATADRIVFVRAADTADDTKAPEIDITGQSPVRLHVGDTYAEQGARCVDDTDGTWDARIHKSTVSTSEVGSYIVIYECADSSDNTSLAIRHVEVAAPEENLPPVITLKGDSEVTIQAGSTYTEQGATCTDPEDGILEVTVRGGNPDTSSAGKRHIHYSCTDSDGKTDSVVRAIIVR